MALDQTTLKMMKSDTLEKLSVIQIIQRTRVHIDENDWKVLGGFVRTSKNLKTLDLSQLGNQWEVLAEDLKENRSISELVLSQTVQDHDVPLLIDVLKANPNITKLTLDNCYIQGGGVYKLGKFFDTHHTLTHISLENVNADHGRGRDGVPQIQAIVRALRGSPNILSFTPDSAAPEMEAVCETNKKRAEELTHQLLKGVDQMTAGDFADLKKRLPAVLHLLESDGSNGSRKELAQAFIVAEHRAGLVGAAFSVPASYADIAAWLPLPFQPSADKVEFSTLENCDQQTCYQAAEAGQVDELMSYLRQKGRRLTAADCLFKPEGKKECMIAVAARQSKLAEVMNVAAWTGDPRGLKEAATGVPAREWKRQMKDMSLERLLTLVNAASFKKHRPRGPGM